MQQLISILLILAIIFHPACKHVDSELLDEQDADHPDAMEPPNSPNWPTAGNSHRNDGLSPDLSHDQVERLERIASGNAPTPQDVNYLEEEVGNRELGNGNGSEFINIDDGGFVFSYKKNGRYIDMHCTGGGRCDSTSYSPEVSSGDETEHKKISGNEKQDYGTYDWAPPRDTSFDPSDWAEDPPATKHDFTDDDDESKKNRSQYLPAPDRADYSSHYRKTYPTLTAFRDEVGKSEKEHKGLLKKQFELFAGLKEEEKAKEIVSAAVKVHNAVVNELADRDVKKIGASVQDLLDQKTPLSTPGGRKVRNLKLRVKNEQLKEINRTVRATKYLSFAWSAANIADDFFSEGKKTEGDRAIEAGRAALDLAADFVPFVSFARDVTVIALGVNPITGKKVSNFERAVTAGLLFMPSTISASAKSAASALKFIKKAGKNPGIIQRQLVEYGQILRRPNFRELISSFIE